MKMPKRLRFQVFTRDDFTCQYCGRHAPDVVLHVDHVYPRAKGGTNRMENLTTACSDCNLGKGVEHVLPPDRDMLTWDGYPSMWPSPDDEILSIAMCDPDFFPAPIV